MRRHSYRLSTEHVDETEGTARNHAAQCIRLVVHYSAQSLGHRAQSAAKPRCSPRLPQALDSCLTQALLRSALQSDPCQVLPLVHSPVEHSLRLMKGGGNACAATCGRSPENRILVRPAHSTVSARELHGTPKVALGLYPSSLPAAMNRSLSY